MVPAQHSCDSRPLLRGKSDAGARVQNPIHPDVPPEEALRLLVEMEQLHALHDQMLVEKGMTQKQWIQLSQEAKDEWRKEFSQRKEAANL